jgi:hypothetical protein
MYVVTFLFFIFGDTFTSNVWGHIMGHIVNRPISDYLTKSFGIKPDYTTHITNKLYHMRMYTAPLMNIEH